MNRDEAREAAWAEFRERCDRENTRISKLLEWKLFFDGFDAGYQAGSEGRGEVAEEWKRIAGELEKIAFFPIITRIPYLLADYIKDRLRADGEKDDGQD